MLSLFSLNDSQANDVFPSLLSVVGRIIDFSSKISYPQAPFMSMGEHILLLFLFPT